MIWYKDDLQGLLPASPVQVWPHSVIILYKFRHKKSIEKFGKLSNLRFFKIFHNQKKYLTVFNASFGKHIKIYGKFKSK